MAAWQNVESSLEPVALAILAIYLTVVAVWDLKTLRVPNLLTLPAIGVVLIWRIVRLAMFAPPVLPELGFLLYWLGVLALWQAGAMGGGDAKLLMVLFGVFPTVWFLLILLAVTGLAMAGILVWRYGRRRKLGYLILSMRYRLSRWQLFPPQGELEAAGEPTAFLFAAAGLLALMLR